jgi:hypothetical protein
MIVMYDEKEVLLSYIESEKYEATKKTAKETAVRMIRAGRMSIEEVPQFFPTLSSDDVKELEDELLQTV